MSNSAELDDPAKIALAEANTAALISEMVIKAESLGLDKLREDSFIPIRNTICPLFPFCK